MERLIGMVRPFAPGLSFASPFGPVDLLREIDQEARRLGVTRQGVDQVPAG
jgi:hypothetical protein